MFVVVVLIVWFFYFVEVYIGIFVFIECVWDYFWWRSGKLFVFFDEEVCEVGGVIGC